MRMSSIGRDAWLPARCSSWREIRPTAPPPERRLPPAQSPCPFHPPPRENSASRLAAWSSRSTYAARTWTNQLRPIARQRCPPAPDRTQAEQPERPPPDLHTAPTARLFPPVA